MEVNKLKLMRATIYGFGSWVDDTVDFSGDSYICIYGENESGKSTLQHFILFMLFGLPPKMRSFYRPKSSRDRKSTRLNSSHVAISYAVFCLKKKNKLEKKPL